ncbi:MULTISPECIES: putative nucleotidyltransferase substrate binding domain-containing protein [Pseudoalteromonas]|uniref:Cyclic nucleotide-binding protein n=2 Tax=Pseudoalteromonas TaxID=53246 RepID=Q3IGA2_PSET1|nr:MULTISPECIES: putative nucleotidyltransferase substrate binding domain-containing protein [Pseudoalteromonas]ASM53990.1 CBS domain-containing protein [Pseudoalteromonas nigrifaciens]MBB1370872.1 cyclic nucleotide-binding/CBS domain-containing protein [Pseudoalteromonas sp. SR45-4]MBB1404423.1 cyclic nucleotide-binding/CBS domain-containing protein [Pseudoalteromonas sp. SG44-5]MBH0093360.1 cyclic nucleotide-binding/CBS domain-containing protein [Pseudoalteromonas sp. SCQQ13]PCC12832.1 cycli|tara:strand:+ start:21172 stop:23067 length:1896 start_codon:yes stop_codon:yes gene_type:complete
MQAEQIEIAQFLAQHPPFNDLPIKALNELAQQVEVAYFRAQTEILQLGQDIADLYVIRSGSVEMYRRNGELYNRLAVGGIFGQMGLLMNRKVRFPATALEDTLVYCINVELFNRYCDEFDAFADYFETDGNVRLHQAIVEQADSNDLTTAKVKSLIHRDVVTVLTTSTVQDVAKLMSEEAVSSVLVTDINKPVNDDPEEDDGQVVGIITDRDLRNKVVAPGLSFDTQAQHIMSTNLVILDANAYVFEAVLAMLRDSLHHLPVVQKRRPIGVISLSDILRYESQSSLLLVRGILAQQSVEDLTHYARQLPNVFVRMVNEDANSHMVGTAMAVIGRTFKQRLLILAEEKYGPAPVPYCFIALGSMARDEQLIVTDQDNALILDDSYNDELHNEYFQNIADFVCDGLAQCGYTYCDGEIMASFKKWRKTRSQWFEQFADWIAKPKPQTLLHSSIFFDLDGVWGKTKWADELKVFVAKQSKANRVFLANMAANARNRTPPLGFFKGFVLEHNGQHKHSMNLKRRGTAPLSDVIRVHALAIGSRKQNSFDRLEDIIAAKSLPEGKAQDLRDALEYIAMMRIRHQALQIEQGEEPDNNLDPHQLSPFEQRNLKEAFAILEKAQNYLKFSFISNTNVK